MHLFSFLQNTKLFQNGNILKNRILISLLLIRFLIHKCQIKSNKSILQHIILKAQKKTYFIYLKLKKLFENPENYRTHRNSAT